MKKKFLFSFCFSLLFARLCLAQGALSFAKEAHDFGNVEEGVQATYEFEFTNTGKAPLIISNVSASCGCTTPFWTKDPVLPGKKGKVTASYNSAGRPGIFNKSITVTSNAEPATRVLTIKGTVVPKTEKPVISEQLEKSAILQLDKSIHNFGKIEKGQAVWQVFTISNTGKSDLQITKVQSACGCVNYSIDKAVIAPGQQAKLELKYAPRSLHQQNEIVTVLSNDLKNPSTSITLQTYVAESLAAQPMLKEQKPVVPFK
jgi:hypothetical protein